MNKKSIKINITKIINIYTIFIRYIYIFTSKNQYMDIILTMTILSISNVIIQDVKPQSYIIHVNQVKI